MEPGYLDVDGGEGFEVSATRSRCTSVNSSAIAGTTSTTATPETINRPVRVALGAAASAIVRVFGSRMGGVNNEAGTGLSHT